jgi:multiple sugar transport system substrate-binding protein
MGHAKKRLIAISLVAATVAFGMVGCASTGSTGSDGKSNTITLWTHNAGNAPELDAVTSIVKAYNASQTKTTVKVQAFPQASYNDSVVAAAAAGKLPCIVDIDGPNVPNWAWAKYLTPLNLTADLSKNLPSTVGKWNGKTYSFGYYDVALAMFARKSVLTDAGIRIATTDKPWTATEFASALKTLKAEGKWDYPLDLGTAGTGEWLPYAYSPFLQSFGGDLINRKTNQTADGALNGAAAIKWADWFQGVIKDKLVAQKSGTDSTIDFQNGKSAILYTGSWAAPSTQKLLGSDLAIMPTVDFGKGPKIGGGSWQWGVTTGCANPKAAMDYLSFSLQPKYVARVAAATGTIPATEAAAALVPGYQKGGDLAEFRDYSKNFAVLRPLTPAYPFISTEFAQATLDIINGGDAKSTLDSAVKAIDANIKSNGGYTQK